jgi:glycosyltransferase involved in cell wall biosynthesis
MISVAMCTYNGARFLHEQLESIAAQTRLPDELVVCDDRSADGSVEIIKSFARRAPFAVRVEINENNLGSTKNFEKAIRTCHGEIIALADQDDIWLPWRLQDTEATLAANPSFGCVFGNGYVVDHQGDFIGRTLWESFEFTPIRRFQVTHGYATLALLSWPAATGATMAFRSIIKEFCLPIPSIWSHDAWIALISSCVFNMGLLPRPVIKYRRHATQQVGASYVDFIGKIKRPRKLGTYEYDKMAAQYEVAYQRLASIEGAANKLKWVSGKMQHLRRRNSLPIQRYRRIPVVIGELLSMHYSLYSTGLLGALRDLTVGGK